MLQKTEKTLIYPKANKSKKIGRNLLRAATHLLQKLLHKPNMQAILLRHADAAFPIWETFFWLLSHLSCRAETMRTLFRAFERLFKDGSECFLSKAAMRRQPR